jgi:putative ABC transport system permease protein
MSNLYAEFYTFPTRPFRISPELVAITIAVGLAAAVAGALGAVRRIARMPPAEAMRPPTPLSYRRSLLERLGLGGLIGPSAMMVVREIRRRPLRFVMSSAGIAMGIGIFIIGRFSTNSFDRLMTEVFPREQLQDTTVVFAHALPERALHELEHVPGVLLAEGQRIVAVRVHAGTHWRDTAITGIPRSSTLRVLFDAGETRVPVPDDGVVMCDRLAAALGVEVGDAVDLELLEGDFSSRRATVVRLIDEAFGLPIYARADWLAGLLREEPRVSAALLRVDPALRDVVSARLKQLPMVMSVTSQAHVIARYDEQVGGSMVVMTLILTLSAAAIATGVVYNNARIALSMRGRDLASLRVLGFTRREISGILLGELAAQVALGIVLGMFVGRWWAALVAGSFPSESFHFPTYISSSTYAAAAVIALASGVASALLVRRRLDGLDLVAVLKSSE